MSCHDSNSILSTAALPLPDAGKPAQLPFGRDGLQMSKRAQIPRIPAAPAQDMEAYNFPLPFLDDDGSIECPPGFVSSADPGDLMSSTDCLCRHSGMR